MNTIYKASATRSVYTSNVFINGSNKKEQFYPVVKFWGPVVSDSYYINDPQPTRGKALTIARNSIKSVKQ